MTDTARRAKVNIGLSAQTAALRMPHHAVSDGSAEPVCVEVRPLTRLRKVRVTVPVDDVTARRMLRSDRLAQVSVFLLIFVGPLTVAAFLVGVAASTIWHLPLYVRLSTIPILLPAIATVLFSIFVHLTRPDFYPKPLLDGTISIEGADKEAAEEWMALNPVGAVRLLE